MQRIASYGSRWNRYCWLTSDYAALIPDLAHRADTDAAVKVGMGVHASARTDVRGPFEDGAGANRNIMAKKDRSGGTVDHRSGMDCRVMPDMDRVLIRQQNSSIRK